VVRAQHGRRADVVPVDGVDQRPTVPAPVPNLFSSKLMIRGRRVSVLNSVDRQFLPVYMGASMRKKDFVINAAAWSLPILFIAIVIALALSGGESYKLAAGLVLGAIVGLFIDPVRQLVVRIWQGPLLDVQLDLYYPPDSPTKRRIFVRLKVENQKSRIATGCRAYLVSVEPKQKSSIVFKDTFPLHWAYEHEVRSVDLPRGVPHYVDVATVDERLPGFVPALTNAKGQQISIGLYAASLWDGQNGEVALTVLVAAEGVKPIAHRIAIDWAGKEWPPKIDG
jgi:hypothetical protein